MNCIRLPVLLEAGARRLRKKKKKKAPFFCSMEGKVVGKGVGGSRKAGSILKELFRLLEFLVIIYLVTREFFDDEEDPCACGPG